MWRTVVRPSPLVSKRSRGIHMMRVNRARIDPHGERRRLAARMRELDADLGRLRVRKVDDPPERRDLRVRPEPSVLRGDAALRHDCGRFHDDAAGAARCETLSARPNPQAACPVSAISARGKKEYTRRCAPSASPSRGRFSCRTSIHPSGQRYSPQRCDSGTSPPGSSTV